MIQAMRHEPFYACGQKAFPELGVYAGWVALEESPNAAQPFSNEAGDITLLCSGEWFPNPEDVAMLARRGHQIGTNPADWLVHAYEEKGERFIEELNGLFNGLLVDRRSGSVLLFNDRYGFDRLYCHEADDALYFASDAGALLRVLPSLRVFDPEGVHQFLAVGCTIGGQTLFKGLRLLPAASVWSLAREPRSKRTYFSPSTWEEQPVLTPGEFQSRFQATLSRIGPRYFSSDSRVGIALTAGLDSRMGLACRPKLSRPLVSYTYGGRTGETLDARIAAQVARACGIDHHVLRLGADFFLDFPKHVDQTVRATGGCFGVLGAHEIYLTRHARALAPVRLTGVCGGEVLREVRTFKPIGLSPGLLTPETRRAVVASANQFTDAPRHPLSFAVFQEIPWNMHGTLAACRSHLTFRTPFLDNELVALAYQAPAGFRTSSAPAVRLIQDLDPDLGAIPTDMGLLGAARGLSAAWMRVMAKLTFKLDYVCTDGLPSGLAFLDPLIDKSSARLGVPGLHKYLWYRRWFRGELAGYLQESLRNVAAIGSSCWLPGFVERMASRHINGRMNLLGEINAVLTLGAVQRLLLGAVPG